MSMEAPTPRRSANGKVATYLVGTILVIGLAAGVFVLAFPKRVAAATRVDGLDVSLLSLEEARDALDKWWEQRLDQPLVLVGPDETAAPVKTTARKLGIALDVDGTLNRLPLDGIGSWLGRASSSERKPVRTVPAVLDFSDLDEDALEEVVATTSPELAAARVVLDEQGLIVRTPEVSVMRLVRQPTERALRDAVTGSGNCVIVAEYGEKEIPDKELEKITGVMSTFSTKFSAGDRSRSKNLKVAAEKLDGAVVMPGEKFSFNEYVGERTPANGFSKAGVYRQGRHEIDWGGGVCQVSTTLFNAVVLADLKVEVRNNHTFLVPYVPIGRDAAVAFGSYDFVFANTSETPIAIDTKYEPGKLTFNLLGVKDDGLEVKLVPVVTEAWTHEPVYVDDPALKPGEEKVVEKGGKGFRAVTTKIVLRDGKEVSRTTLCKSYYKGGPKIIHRGPKAEPEPKKDEFAIPPINPGL